MGTQHPHKIVQGVLVIGVPVILSSKKLILNNF